MVAALGVVAACGRFGFDSHEGAGTGGDATQPADATSDALIGGACSMFTQIALGEQSTCMVGADGTRWCTGANAGMGFTNPATKLTRANGELGWTTLALGDQLSAGLRNNQLWAWSMDDAPIEADPAGDWTTIGGETSAFCAVKSDGTLVCGNTAIPGTWMWASAGDQAFCGVKTDNTLWCWGVDRSNVLGQGVEPDGTVHATPVQVGAATDWKDVDVGSEVACGRRLDNTLYCWGNANYDGTGFTDTLGVPTQVSGRNNWVAYYTRWHHTCAVKDDHGVECFGADEFGLEVIAGQTSVGNSSGLGTSWDDFRSGGHHYCGLLNNLWYCWGGNAEGQLGVGDVVTRAAATTPLCSL
jgi:hypothetical protein